ncbi:hypothetical protein ACTA71_002726 [Dictyostelium dimigraforme]
MERSKLYLIIIIQQNQQKLGGNQNNNLTTATIVQEWYKKREIDRKSSQINNSLSLIDIAIQEKHFSNLIETRKDLEELSSISTNRNISEIQILYDRNTDIVNWYQL